MAQGASCDGYRHSACREIISYRYTTFLVDAQQLLLPKTHDYSCRHSKTMPADTRQLILYTSNIPYSRHKEFLLVQTYLIKLEGPEIESRWGEFPPVQTGLWTHPASCTMGTGSFPMVKYGRSVLLTTHPLLLLQSWKGRAIPLPTLWATTGSVTG